MKIDNVNLRVIKTQGDTEVFMTGDHPVVNTVFRLPASLDLESGNYSVTFTKVEPPSSQLDLSKMSKAELVAEAERLGLTVVPDGMSKLDIIAVIEGK